MAKRQTKKVKLDELFHRARVDLPRHMFTNWLSFCYGIFEHAAGANRKVNRYDIKLIAKELSDLRDECGYLDDFLAVDRQVEKEFRMAGKVV